MKKTYQYKLYKSKRNRELEEQIEIAARIWNHCINLHKQYYRRTGKHLSKEVLQKHITRLKKRPKIRYLEPPWLAGYPGCKLTGSNAVISCFSIRQTNARRHSRKFPSTNHSPLSKPVISCFTITGFK